MADTAKLIIEIDPPVQGAAQTVTSLQQVSQAAQQASSSVQAAGRSSQTALVGISANARGAVSGFQSLSTEVANNAGSLQYLLRTIAPLGGSFAIATSQIERAALMIERLTTVSELHVTKQQVLNQAFQQGTIGAATMEAALAKVAQTTAAAEAATARFAIAQSALAAAQKEAAAASILTGQRRLDVYAAKQSGDPAAISLSQRDLGAALAYQTQQQVAVRQATQAFLPIQQQNLALAQQQAAAQRAVAAASSASTFSLGAMSAVIGGLITVLAGLAIGAYAVVKAFEGVKEAIAAAGAAQAADVTFKGLVGDAKVAEDQLTQLKTFWQTSGIFKLDDLVQAASNIKNFGASTQNVIGYTESLAAAAARLNVSVTSMGDAFERAMVGRMQKPSNEMIILLRQIGIDLGVTNDKVRQLFQDSSPAEKMKLLTDALRGIATTGGAAFDAIQERQDTWAGQLEVLSARWQAFYIALGKPIIDVLTPLLASWNKQLSLLVPLGAQWGKDIADIITWTEKWASSIGNVIDKLKQVGVLQAASHLPFVGPLIGAATTGFNVGSALTTPPATGANIPTNENMIPSFPGGKDNFILGLEHGTDALDKWKSDISEINNAWQNFEYINITSGDELERQRRSFDELVKLAKELYDPSQLQPYIQALAQQTGMSVQLVQSLVQQAEAKRQQLIIDEQIKAGTASWQDSVTRGLEKTKEAFGTWQQGIEKATEQIGNALSNDIASNLSKILEGTVSVAQGFKNMALAIVTSIEQIIIKMLVELALQQAISGLQGGSIFTGAGSSSASLGALGGSPYAIGGGVRGGSGSRDDVPAMLTGGEYVLTRGDVQRMGGAQRIDSWRRGYAGGGWVEGIDFPAAEGPGSNPRYGYGDMPSGGITAWGGDPVREIPSENITWNAPPFPTDTGGGYPVPGYNLSNYVPVDWVANATWGGGGTSSSGYGTSGSNYSVLPGGSIGGGGGFNTFGSYFGGSRQPISLNLSGALASQFSAWRPAGLSAAQATRQIFTSGGRGWTPTRGTPNLRTSAPRSPFALGGLVIPSFAEGGVMPWDGLAQLHKGETVIPSNSSSVQNNISVSVVNGQATTKGSGLSDSDARELARSVEAAVNSTLNKQRRVGGSLYTPRSALG